TRKDITAMKKFAEVTMGVLLQESDVNRCKNERAAEHLPEEVEFDLFMKKTDLILKKVLPLLLAGTMLFGTAACTEPTQKPQYGEDVPTYETDEEFYIGMWIGVPSSMKTYDEETGVVIDEGRALTDEEFDQHYKLIKEAGFNYVDPGYGETAPSYNERALAAAQKYGLHQYVHDNEINAWLMDDIRTDEEAETKLAQLAQRYTKYDSFAGLKIRDEPSIDQIADYSYAKKRFDKVFGDKNFYINLFPVIAGSSLISADYKDYIKEYVKEINTPFVSYDHYPLKVNSRGQNYVIENFLWNMELVREAAPNKQMWTFLQSMGYGSSNRELTSVADATFQAYSFLAYGGNGIQWFCYWSPPVFDGATVFKDACIDRSGKTTKNYDYIKQANLEIRALEDIYLNFDWQGVMTTIGSENDNGGENNSFNYLSTHVKASHDRIKSMKTQQDTFTGVFKDAQGRDGFMIVNYTEPSQNLKNKVELQFNNCTRAIVVKKGVQEVVDCTNGALTFTMDAGEGYFVIPLK
ncbi:MAG: hypothetical protein J6D30_03620, partial [Clostridia bacterium]|nr:hypothetical protein [Clostridia bacterium]